MEKEEARRKAENRRELNELRKNLGLPPDTSEIEVSGFLKGKPTPKGLLSVSRLHTTISRCIRPFDQKESRSSRRLEGFNIKGSSSLARVARQFQMSFLSSLRRVHQRFVNQKLRILSLSRQQKFPTTPPVSDFWFPSLVFHIPQRKKKKKLRLIPFEEKSPLTKERIAKIFEDIAQRSPNKAT